MREFRGIYLPTDEQISQFEKYSKAEFSIAGIYVFLFILEYAYFSVQYWALANKLEGFITDKQQSCAPERKSHLLLLFILAIDTSGVIAMIFEMCILPPTPQSKTATLIT